MKDLQFVQDAFKQSVHNTVSIEAAANAIIADKMRRMTPQKWDDVLNYVNSLKFPLVVYRGFKYLNGKDDVRLSPKDLGINWTIDKELFRSNDSHFNNCDYITVGEITEDQVDWVQTIQNYIYYSLDKISGRYPEKEVTLKGHQLPRNLIGVFSKEELFNNY